MASSAGHSFDAACRASFRCGDPPHLRRRLPPLLSSLLALLVLLALGEYLADYIRDQHVDKHADAEEGGKQGEGLTERAGGHQHPGAAYRTCSALRSEERRVGK